MGRSAGARAEGLVRARHTGSSNGVANDGMASAPGASSSRREGRRRRSPATTSRVVDLRWAGRLGAVRRASALGVVVGVGMVLVGAVPAEALSKEYGWREEVPVMANSVSENYIF